jgi:hypothetical protein
MAHDVDVNLSTLRTILQTLSQPITSSTHLSQTLSTLIQVLRNAATKSHQNDDDQSRSPRERLIKLVSQIQTTVVEKVLPVWDPVLDTTAEGTSINRSILELFVPLLTNGHSHTHSHDIFNNEPGPTTQSSPSPSSSSSSSADHLPTLIALTSFQTISLHLPLTPSPIPLLRILNHLIQTYPIEQIHLDLYFKPDLSPSSYPQGSYRTGTQRMNHNRRKKDIHSDLLFKGYSGLILTLPSKISNTLGRYSELKYPGQRGKGDLDGLEGLEEGRYWARLFSGLEEVLWGLSLRGGVEGEAEGEGEGESALGCSSKITGLKSKITMLIMDLRWLLLRRTRYHPPHPPVHSVRNVTFLPHLRPTLHHHLAILIFTPPIILPIDIPSYSLPFERIARAGLWLDLAGLVG